MLILTKMILRLVNRDCKLEGWNWLSSNHLSLPTPNLTIWPKETFYLNSRKSPRLVISIRIITHGMVGIGCHQIIWARQHKIVIWPKEFFYMNKATPENNPRLVIFLRFITNGMVGIGCYQIMWACQHQMPPFASLAMSWCALWSSSSQSLPTPPLESFDNSKSYSN